MVVRFVVGGLEWSIRMVKEVVVVIEDHHRDLGVGHSIQMIDVMNVVIVDITLGIAVGTDVVAEAPAAEGMKHKIFLDFFQGI